MAMDTDEQPNIAVLSVRPSENHWRTFRTESELSEVSYGHSGHCPNWKITDGRAGGQILMKWKIRNKICSRNNQIKICSVIISHNLQTSSRNFFPAHFRYKWKQMWKNPIFHFIWCIYWFPLFSKQCLHIYSTIELIFV